MNGFDQALLLWLNRFANRWPTLDAFAVVTLNSTLLKSGVIFGALWWVWFTPRPDVRRVRAKLVTGILGSGVAVLVGRLLAHVLPFRVRPMHDPSLHFVLPHTASADQLRGWSAFPSDHAMLFTAVAVGLFAAAPAAGVFALLWTLLVIELPRVYLGFHWPTDVIGGSLIGAAIAGLLQAPAVRDRLARPMLAWLEKSPGSFYAVLFVLTLQIGLLFDDVRWLIKLLVEALHLRQG